MIEASEQWIDELIPDSELDLLKDKSYSKAIKRPGDKDYSNCFSLNKRESGWVMSSSYFIGVDWIEERNVSVRIKPKFDNQDGQVEVNFLQMLEDALKDPLNIDQLDGLLYVDFNKPSISIPKQDDILSLFLISEFLQVMKRITEKGLKKSYYFVEANQSSKIKGKLLLAKTIKKDHLHGNFSDNYCRFQVFGADIPENRLLKKAVIISSHILNSYKTDTVKSLKQTIADISPKWKSVDDKCDPSKIGEGKVNPFFKEYPIAMHLAKLILKKQSFNQVLHNASISSTPPYWIDMSKLFEMLVLAKLRKTFGNKVLYQPQFGGQRPDYLLMPEEGRPPYIIDAKYKKYGESPINTDDIRQVSGYGRMKLIRKKLSVVDHTMIPCLIIYPEHDGLTYIPVCESWQEEGRYLDVYKLGIKLPLIEIKE